MPSIGGGSSGFSVASREQDGVLVVAVRGAVDSDTAPALAHDFEAAANASAAVVVDLCGASFMDSAGLYALLVLRRRLVERSRRLALAFWPDGAIAMILHVSGVEELFEIHPSRAAAVEALSAAG
jgi:anti-anti-sigma factor